MTELAAQFKGVAAELKIAERPAAHSELGLGDPGLVAAQLVTIAGVLTAITGASPLVAGGLVAADLVGAAWGQAMSALALRRRCGSIGQNIEPVVLANARMLGAVSLSVPVLLVLDRTDLANEVMLDLALGATELDEGRVLAVMFEPDGRFSDRSVRIASRVGGLPTSQQHRVHVERADPVDQASLAGAVREVCGGKDSALVEAVVGQVNTLGALGRLVRSPAIGAQLKLGTLTPADVRAWVDRGALQTPVGVDQQRCLAVAGVLGQSVPSVVLTHVLGEPAETSIPALRDLGWLVEISPGLFRFPNGAAVAAAAGTATEFLTPQEQQAATDAPAELLRALIRPNTPVGEDLSRAELWTLAHSVADGPPASDDLADRLWQVAQDAADQGAFMVASRLGRAAAIEDENQTARRVMAARWAEQVTDGELPDDDPIETVARGLLRLAARRNANDELVVDQTSVALGELSGHIQDNLLAGWWLELAERLAERGEADRAEDALARSRELPSDDGDVEAGQDRLAVELESGVAGRQRLVARLTEELDDRLSIGGVRDVPAVIGARQELAEMLEQLGESRQALFHCQAALPDQVELLGPEHPDTLSTRHRIALWTGKAGDRRLALKLSEELLPSMVGVFGTNHPGTLSTRHNIALWAGQLGETRTALKQFEALLRAQAPLLGPDHPDTLTTRHNIAALTGELGDGRVALELFEELLPDMARVWGPGHPNTLGNRRKIASMIGELGDSQTALELFEGLLPEMVRVLGVDHPDTLSNRQLVASWTGREGDILAALKLSEELLPDRARVLGPDHPQTLETRSSCAFWTVKAGDGPGALTLFEALLPDLVRVLGPDHPKTLTTRSNIAGATGELGDGRVALELLEELLPDLVRVLGPGHPETLTTRDSIARRSKV